MDTVRLALALLVVSTAHGTPDWDQFKVRFDGFDCNQERGFFSLPRTEDEAVAANFRKISGCFTGQSSMKWSGKRYVSDDWGDQVVLLYDINGYIAGVQSGIPRTGDFPPRPLIRHPFIRYRGKYYITFYFMNPADICRKGRNETSFAETGTAMGLYLQNGTRRSEVVEIPKDEPSLATTEWSRGVCVPVMGQHYRHKWSADRDCDSLEPAFIMYNNGRLDGFGWTIVANISSEFLEHPPVIQAQNTPRCMLEGSPTLTSLHFYLSEPCTRTCPPGQNFLTGNQ